MHNQSCPPLTPAKLMGLVDRGDLVANFGIF